MQTRHRDTAMPGLKYLILLVRGRPVPVLFGADVAHAAVARSFGQETVLVSAGFCRIRSGADGIEVDAGGRSESLDRDSRPADAEVIRRELLATRDADVHVQAFR